MWGSPRLLNGGFDMNRLLPVLVLAALLAAPAMVLADTEVHTVSANGPTDLYATLDIPQFDPGKGDLLQVTLEIAGTIDGYFYYENLSAGGGGYRILENTWNFAATLQGTGLVADTGTMSTPFVSRTAFDGVEDYAGTSGAKVPYSDTTAATGTYLPADTGFAGFKGTATLPLTAATTIWSSYSAAGGASHSGLHTDAAWTVTVTYSYRPASVATENRTWGGVKTLFR
jgi:hypothetical protein